MIDVIARFATDHHSRYAEGSNKLAIRLLWTAEVGEYAGLHAHYSRKPPNKRAAALRFLDLAIVQAWTTYCSATQRLASLRCALLGRFLPKLRAARKGGLFLGLICISNIG